MILAIAQMLVEPGNPAANLARAVDRIGEASRHGADVVLFPETLDCGWTHPSARLNAAVIPDGAACSLLCAAAKREQVYVCAGLTERATDKLYNSAVLIDECGNIALVHRKIHELEIAEGLYARGDRLNVVETPFGVVGVMICADAFAEGLPISRSLGLMGARIILSPCAWAVPAEHDPEREPYGKLWIESYRPVAKEFGLWIAGASNVGPIVAGPWSGHKCIGCSMVVSPDGNPTVVGPYGEMADCLLFATL